MLRRFNLAYDVNSLVPSLLKTLSVLNSKSEDLEKLLHVTDFRLTRLCNVDCKIFAKILTNRLQSVIVGVMGDN